MNEKQSHKMHSLSDEAFCLAWPCGQLSWPVVPFFPSSSETSPEGGDLDFAILHRGKLYEFLLGVSCMALGVTAAALTIAACLP